MAVYVDELFKTRPNKVWPFKSACHMTADSHDELVAFARSLRLRVEWIQHEGRPTEHFDLSAGMRHRAVASGAIEESWRDAAARFKVGYATQTP